MTEPRPWNTDEDRLLIQAVKIHGELDMWKTIALAVPGRTNKACRKRWLHSLAPTVKKSAWTPSEDKKLIECYKMCGPKWAIIARQIEGRTDDACSKRYREALDPSLKKDEWTKEEDEKLVEVFSRLGGKWGQVGQELHRSGLACRNRLRLLERKNKDTSIKQTEIPPRYDSSSSQHDTPPNVGYPYYPPEAYPIHPADDMSCFTPAFREFEPSQELSPIHTTLDLPPFKPSSSSLSAALSAPPPKPRPLPALNTDITYDPSLSNHSYHRRHSEPGSPSTYPDTSGSVGSTLSSLPSTNSWQLTSQTPHPSTGIHLQEASWEGSSFAFQPSSAYPSYSDYSVEVLDFAMPPSAGQDLYSSSSTPTFASLSLSPSSPPNVLATSHSAVPGYDNCFMSVDNEASQPSASWSSASALHIHHYDSLPTGETSFSKVSGPRSKSARVRVRIRPKKPPKDAESLRLNSKLTVTSDHSVLPYACGHDQCWPSDGTASRACFATSKELTDHTKSVHPGLPGEKPYRCALAGCGKSWKNVNGLQYHLQISRAHFQQALKSTLATSMSPTEPPEDQRSPLERDDSNEHPKKLYVCKYPDCTKVYKQQSGLRYHTIHGHSSSLPAQLEVVPPALTRKLAGNGVKKRPSTTQPIETTSS